MKIIILTTLLILSSCSSLKRSIFYGGTTGAILGGIAGSMLGKSMSPNPESVQGNALLFGSAGVLVGAGIGASIGAFLYNDDPDNRPLKQMILDEKKDEIRDAVSAPMSDIHSINVEPTSPKLFDVPTASIPDSLKGKVPKQYFIEREIPERVEQLDNGKTIIYEAHKVYEAGLIKP